MRVVGAALVLLAFPGCSTHLNASETAACKASGGRVEKVFGQYTCLRHHEDGGKPCTDGDDCLGDCIADYDASHPPTLMCTSTNPYFGCYAVVEDGIVPDEYRCSP